MNRSRPVAFVVPDATPIGAQRVAFDIAEELRQEGVEVDVLVGAPFGRKEWLERPSTVTLLSSTELRIPGLRRVIWQRRLQRSVEKGRYVTYVGFSPICNMALARARYDSAHLVGTEHIHLSTAIAERSMYSKALALKYSELVTKPYQERFERVVAVSEGIQRDLIDVWRVPAARVVTITNPVDRLRLERDARKIDPIATERPRIVALGRLERQKGFDLLLEACARLPESIAWDLVILGEGPDRPLLEGQRARLGLDDRVQLPGHVEPIAPTLSRAHLFVLSSRWEGYPLALAEAAALGIPSVSFDCPTGPSEILKQGLYGRLVTVGSVDGLAIAIAELLAGSSRECEELRARVQTVRARFDVATVAARYRSLLEELDR